MTTNHSDKNHDKSRCPQCLSINIYGMSRVVGYYSIIENWNDSKQAELKDRKEGYYKLGEKPKAEVNPHLLKTTPQKVRLTVD